MYKGFRKSDAISPHLRQRGREVVAVPAHEVVPISAELLAQLLQDLVHVAGPEVRVAQVDRLLEAELFAQLLGGPEN